MASSTWLGSKEPLVQAEPEEALMPFRSSMSSRLSPSTPWKQKLTLPGRRSFRSPFNRHRSICRMASMSLSRMAVSFSRRSWMVAQAAFMAAARPTIWATFSVPPRFPRSWAPPSSKLGMRTPRRMYRAPTPLGAWSLCPERDSMSMFCSLTSMGTWPTAWTASVWNQIPFSRQSLPIWGMGWRVPISLLAYMMVTRPVSSVRAASSSSTRTMPFSWTGR